MSELDDMIKLQSITLNDILNNLLKVDESLDLKTHIFNPRKLSSLYVLGQYLDKSGYKKSSKIIDVFIEKYLRYMISYKRESRKEIIRAISNLAEQDSPTVEALTKNLK